MRSLMPLFMVTVISTACVSNTSQTKTSAEQGSSYVPSEADLALIAAKIESDAKNPEYESIIRSIVRKENLDDAIRLAIQKDNLAAFLKLMNHAGLSEERVAKARVDAVNSYQLSLPFYMHLVSTGVNLAENSQAVLLTSKENLLFLLRYGAQAATTDKWGSSRLHRENDPEIIEVLVKNGANPNTKNKYGEAALHTYDRSIDAFKKLLELGADANSIVENGKRTPLFYINGSIPHLDALIEAGADPNAKDYDGSTILRWRVRLMDSKAALDFVQALLNHGADANIADNDGFTPLFAVDASLDNDFIEQALDLLLKQGADINHQSRDGWTVLATLAGHSFTEPKFRKMKWLLSNGARTDLFSNTGESPLSRAARSNQDMWMSTLLKHGVDINQRNAEGNTAMFYTFFLESAKYLIDHGADPTIRNLKGEAAFEFNNVSKDSACREYLHVEYLKRVK
jgi:ankyrin repeat protein